MAGKSAGKLWDVDDWSEFNFAFCSCGMKGYCLTFCLLKFGSNLPGEK